MPRWLSTATPPYSLVMSRGPLFRIDRVDSGPQQLIDAVPCRIRMLRVLPGPDRPDYCLGVLDVPVTHHTTLALLTEAGVDVRTADPQMSRVLDDGTVWLQVFGVVLCARLAGQQVRPGMADLSVNVAYVVDNSLLQDDRLDFRKVLFAAIASVSEEAEPTASFAPG